VAKRIKKPPVKPERRRDWLRRFEEDGEPITKIASTDSFDLRTVRKHIQLAKEEREFREARTLVLRTAMERHYDDMRKFAEKLDSEIRGGSRIQASTDDDFIEAALRQHLPRSPLWSYLTKRQDLLRTVEEQQPALDKKIQALVNRNRRLATLTKGGELPRIIPGIVDLLVFEAKQWLSGNTRHTLGDSMVKDPAGEGFVNPRFGFSHMGVMSQELADMHMPTVHHTIGDLESSVKNFDEYLTLRKTISEMTCLKEKLREELAIVRLKRIIPGHCKFCPLN
jgi:hypothetical protein